MKQGFFKEHGRITLGLISINILYFFFIESMDYSKDVSAMLELGASYAPFIIERGEYWRLCSAIFMHFGIEHIANNMLVLFVLGDRLERTLGSFKYFIVYMGSGIGANIVSLYFDMHSVNPPISAGASGAIFGIVGSLLWAILANKGRLETLTTRGMMFSLFLMLYFGFISTGVNHIVHISGAIIGFLLTMLLYRKEDLRG